MRAHLTGLHLLGLHEGILTRRPVGHHSVLLRPPSLSCLREQSSRRSYKWSFVCSFSPLLLWYTGHTAVQTDTSWRSLAQHVLHWTGYSWEMKQTDDSERKRREHRSRQLNCSHGSPDVSRQSYDSHSDTRRRKHLLKKLALHHSADDF